MPQRASQSSATPPLPPGYTIDASAASSAPPLPPGYKLDQQAGDQNKPGMLASAWNKFKDTIQGPIDIPGAPNISRQLGEVRDMGNGMVKNIEDISAPAIAGQIYQKFTGQPNQLKELPGKIVTQGIPLMFGEPEADAAVPRSAVRPAPEAAAAEAPTSGVLSRVMDVAKRRAGHIPGVQAVKDASYIVRGGEDATPAAPEQPAPSVPEFWGKGQFGTPVDQWGSRIPDQPGQAGTIAASMQKPAAAEVAPGFQRGSLQTLLDRSLGAKQLDPKVPLRNQMDVATPAARPASSSATVPEGHIPVQSTALKSYKYDAGAGEFHAKYGSADNTVHVFGDVTPKEAQAFGDAPSKGQAMQQIKNGHPLVAKIINGKRVAVKAAQ